MWVMNRDKDVLIFSKRFFINEFLSEGKIVGYSIDTGSVELGRYNTKEEARRVLLQLSYKTKDPSDGVFYMP